MPIPEEFRHTRDAEKLLREVDAAIKIQEIKRTQDYRYQVEPKWWESGIVMLLFISSLGFILTIFKLLPSGNRPLFWFVFFWFVLFTLTLVATVEFLLVKIHALRRLLELHRRTLERQEKQLKLLSERTELLSSNEDEHAPRAEQKC